ncbi:MULTISPECIES: tail fiber protein [unclassified Mesorhizobium]|uniref:phage tail protein n=1 Tax=unclassified Mesorhizobium TaxID=325217 RepID=UPI001126A1AF|nr:MULTISPECIES: tail fiber protein [unclassified Mesorhizobium]MCA0026975.1 tail fiber protein [Mesorhizobium sp. B263B1A]TPK01219.1 phage tail protein [Mesorhizobium sp. B2-5-12]TPK26350.1 phage tail protein [Mesorhizobium sp. B2-5-6]TPK59846.1 phage tail protein [Mesorhizobium sp. B2-5-1]TPM51505.1 phage tail protein [Mesorhizobium sp. B2-2-3]
MAQPYVGEVRMFAGNFQPAGWMFCQGQLLPISENETLFQLIGTTYGGDGQSTFALPDLRGRLPLNQGNGFFLAGNGGIEEVALSIQQIPAHSHPMLASNTLGNDPNPGGHLAAESSAISLYSNAAPSVAMGASSTSLIGLAQPHSNYQPYLCVNFIISLFGIFPSPT